MKRGRKPYLGGMTGIAVHLRAEQLDRLTQHTQHLGIAMSAYCRMAIVRQMDADAQVQAPSLAPEHDAQKETTG